MSTGKVYMASDQARVRGRRLEFKTRSPGALLTRAPNAGSAGLNSIYADGQGKQMERLGTCIDALRVLARSSDADRAVLVERYIDAYLTTETVSVWHAVERLGKAIHDEHAKRREGEDWSLAKDYVRSVLHRMT